MAIFSAVQRLPLPPSPVSSSAFATTVVINPHPSRWLLGYWWGSHGLALVSILFSGLPFPLRAILLAVLATGAWWRRPGLPGRVIAHRDGRWTVPDYGVVGQPPGRGSVRSPYVVRVCLADEAGRRHVVWLARDSMNPDQWRRLQVLLGV